jgi:hypothetical protein
VFGQWTRAEPGFRPRTREEVEAEHEEWLAGLDAWVEAEVAEAQRARADDVRERDEILSGQPYPGMEDNRKQAHLAGLDQAITHSAEAAGRMVEAAGDPEGIADVNGWLPAERRPSP